MFFRISVAAELALRALALSAQTASPSQDCRPLGRPWDSLNAQAPLAKNRHPLETLSQRHLAIQARLVTRKKKNYMLKDKKETKELNNLILAKKKNIILLWIGGLLVFLLDFIYRKEKLVVDSLLILLILISVTYAYFKIQNYIKNVN